MRLSHRTQYIECCACTCLNLRTLKNLSEIPEIEGVMTLLWSWQQLLGNGVEDVDGRVHDPSREPATGAQDNTKTSRDVIPDQFQYCLNGVLLQ